MFKATPLERENSRQSLMRPDARHVGLSGARKARRFRWHGPLS